MMNGIPSLINLLRRNIRVPLRKILRQMKKPDIKKSIKNEKKGGLGIFISRKLMDGFDYKRDNNQNILTIYKKLTKAGASESV